MKKNIITILIGIFSFAFTYCQNNIENCYIIKFVMTHDDHHDHLKWQKAATLVNSLVSYHNDTAQQERTAESFCKDLDTTAQTIKAIEGFVKGDDAFHITMNTFNKEELPLDENSPGEFEIIEITVTFKIFDTTAPDNKNKINTLMSGFSKMCNASEVSVAIDMFGDTTQTIMRVLLGTADIYVSMFENPQIVLK